MKFCTILSKILYYLGFMVANAETENEVPEVGDQIAGFTVTEIGEETGLDAKIVYLTHNKTGGPVVWIANNDTNRVFTIGFRTHYDTDTGVPHVFEHAALSGSERYPDPSLFLNLMSNTCQTYLNASTSPYATIYPCASISDKQLLKFADLYLAGVFEPLVLTDKHAMQREAYRYQLANADSDLELVGTVYTEMLGSYYANEEMYALLRSMYPGSWYSTCTGGQPGVIEEMTQQDLIDFHSTYYQPSNAMTVLYGDLNLEDFLTLLNSYYDRYDRVDVSTEDPNYKPFTGTTERTVEISASADAAAETTLYYAVPLRNMSDLDVATLESVLNTAINNTASSLYNIMMERYPTSTFSMSIQSSGAEPMIYFCLDQAGDITAADFAASVQEGISGVLSEGIHYEMLKAALKRDKITESRLRESSGIGVSLATGVVSEYALTGDTHFFFKAFDTKRNEMEAWISSGIIEKTLGELVIGSEDRLLLTINKVPGRTEENQAAAAQKLVDKKASMTDEEIAETVAATQEYNAWTEEIAKINMIGEVAVLSIDELPEEVHSANVNVISENGIRYISAELENCETVTLNIYLKTDMIPTEQLQAYSFAVSALGNNSTSAHSYTELEALTSEYNISFNTATITDGKSTDIFTPAVCVSIDCLKEDLSAAIKLVKEILTGTRFNEFELIRYDSTAAITKLKQVYSQTMPHMLISAIGSAIIGASGLYSYNIDLYPYFRYLDRISKLDDTAMTAEAEIWASIISSIIDRSGMQCTIVGSADGVALAKQLVGAMTADWPLTARAAVDYASEMEKLPSRVAVTFPGFAAYNFKVVSAKDAGYTYTPDMAIMNSLVYDQLLIPVMRYNNGVYSPANGITKKATFILAYRDPSLTATYEQVIPALGGMLSSMDITEEQLANLVISAYTKLATPVGPYETAINAVEDVLNNTDSVSDKLEAMEAYKNATVESVRAHSCIYDALAEKGAIVSAVPATMLKENPDYFDLVISWFVE